MAKSRAVFEEVGERRAAPAAAPGAAERRKLRNRRIVAGWLLTLAALVSAMVLVGGATRLTDSGLSMVSWRPVMGALPPLSEADWTAAFERYRQTAQYRYANPDMTLAEFRSIYWWEWAHRQLGRLIGLVWAGGLAAFMAFRMVPTGALGALVLPGLLGAAQAVVGWWMVESGVAEGSELVSVAPYRLALHLGLAFLILTTLLWPAWRLARPEWELLQARRRRAARLAAGAGALVALVFVQIVLGALVAGNDAGRGFTDWPLMAGEILPSGALALEPAWRNLVEGDALTQFNHRVVGYLLALAALGYWLAARRALRGVRRWAGLAALAVWLQMAWGIVTVMSGAALWLALIHQAGAIGTLAVALRARFETAYPAEQSVRG